MKTIMEKEAREAPKKIALQLQENADVIKKLCQKIESKPIQFAMTIGRGSSDHACTYAKYLLETQIGMVTASAAPSVVTVYNSELHVAHALVIAISQSGKSPDLCKMLEECAKKGAVTVAIVNDDQSPLAKIAEFVIPMHVGEEKAVAATKSYIAALTAIAQFVAILTKDKSLLDALKHLPESLEASLGDDSWQSVINEFKNIDRTFVIGRGFGFPIAQEAALKFKETAGIQAEAFSAAEIYHGPFALIRKAHPFLLFAQSDETLDNVLNLAAKIKELGGKSLLALPQNVFFASEENTIASEIIKLPKSIHPVLDPIAAIQAFYPMVARLAVVRGFDPDHPQHLQKVTETF